MISSMDLFFNRDCAVGNGPEVDDPNAAAPVVPNTVPLICAVVALSTGFVAGPNSVDDAGVLDNGVVDDAGTVLEGAACDVIGESEASRFCPTLANKFEAGADGFVASFFSPPMWPNKLAGAVVEACASGFFPNCANRLGVCVEAADGCAGLSAVVVDVLIADDAAPPRLPNKLGVEVATAGLSAGC